MPKSKIHDLIIVGCGPAGMAACLYAARQKLDFACISSDVGGLANFIPHVETYLGYHYLSGFDLVERFKEHLDNFKITPIVDTVTEIKKTKNGFVISAKKKYFSRSVIIATGRKPRKLGIEGEEEFERRGVSYCTACDGPLFKGRTIAIIGGGRSGLLSTLFVKDLARKIYLIESGKELGGTPAWREAVKKEKRVTILTSTKPVRILGNRMASKLVVKQGRKEKTLAVGGVFVEIGYVSNTDFARGVVKINSRDEIIIDKENGTNTAGIFAAGDCTDIQEKQVVVSVGEGAKALLSVMRYLGLHEKTMVSAKARRKKK